MFWRSKKVKGKEKDASQRRGSDGDEKPVAAPPSTRGEIEAFISTPYTLILHLAWLCGFKLPYSEKLGFQLFFSRGVAFGWVFRRVFGNQKQSRKHQISFFDYPILALYFCCVWRPVAGDFFLPPLDSFKLAPFS
jgi:hypothetical protein